MKNSKPIFARAAFAVALVLLIFALSPACKKNESVAAPKAKNNRGGQIKLDVCALIKNDEVEKITGSAVKETKSSNRPDIGLRISQCYYLAAEASKSVSLEVTDADPGVTSDRSPLQAWDMVFGSYEKKNEGKESEAEKEKKESLREQKREEGEGREAPKKIEGVGDVAFWSGNRVGGALYALDKKKNAYVRVSIGGPDDEETRIAKSKALATKALGRLE